MKLQRNNLKCRYSSYNLLILNFFNFLACVDNANWNNGHGYNCANYAEKWCENGKARPGQEWALGERFNYPEQHCCVCGKSGNNK